MSKITRCKGCGITLQDSDANQIGYVKSIDSDYCQSCFRLLHYGESHDHFHPEHLPELKTNSLIVMVSSALHLDMLFQYPIYRYQKEATYVYLINQIDILPKQTNFDGLLQNAIKRAKLFNIPYQDIILMSAKNKEDIARLKTYLKGFNKEHIYLIGVQNSGKTTIFKALSNDDKPLSLKKAGLTQEPLIKPFGRGALIDMPGLFQPGYIHEFLPYDVYKRMLPDEEINPRIYQLRENQSILIENLIGLTVFRQTSVVLYLAKTIHIHKTNPERMKALFIDNEVQRITVSKRFTRSISIPKGKQQITLADFGFLHLEGPCFVECTAPKGLHITVSEALFK